MNIDGPDDRQEDREHDENEGRSAGRSDAADLAGDDRRLGLGQVDVGDDEGHRGVPDVADLARRPGGGRRGPPGGGTDRGPGGGGFGRPRVGRCVRSDRPGSCSAEIGRRWGSAPMIAAHRHRPAPLAATLGWPDACSRARRLVTAELLSIGTELTVGETRDTNAGELARSLTDLGVRVGRITALPDDLAIVTEAFVAGLERADLVVSTGGLGPTPDDLTREAIAAACGETPAVDPELEALAARAVDAGATCRSRS